MQHIGEPLSRPPVVQPERPARLERYLDPAVHEGTFSDHRALTLGSQFVPRRRAGLEPGGREPKAGQHGRAKRQAHPIHFVLIRVVPRRVETLPTRTPVEHLDRKRMTVRPPAHETERPIAFAVSRRAPSRRADQYVSSKAGYVHDYDASARPGGRVPQHERRSRFRGALARPVRVVAHQVEHAASHDLARQSFHLCEAGFHGPGDVIARTPPDRVVELALHQRAPGDIEQRPPVPTPPGRGPPPPPPPPPPGRPDPPGARPPPLPRPHPPGAPAPRADPPSARARAPRRSAAA